MSSADTDTTLYIRRKHSPPPSVLLLTKPNDNNYDYSSIISNGTHQPTNIIDLHVKNSDVQDTSNLSFTWQRYSKKSGRISLAPDVAYRNRYLDEIEREKFNINNGNNQCYSISSRSQKSFQSEFTDAFLDHKLKSLEQQNSSYKYSTIYDYLRASIRDNEQRRNSAQQNLSLRVKRSQNEDYTLRRALANRKSSIRISTSRSSSTTTQSISTYLNKNIKSPQSFVNYISYSRVANSIKSNQT
ncbi:unnamed protein product [Rotaria socialis]|uniref:Uncharacterized protein n=1 Tax=Rotaria socialis TaxID=392032 RepID=A0A818PN60_9BILA|nr:unnamed protein product [Rotaria socialis]CAF4623565.1 unnamed protein product [Rotaria socialis]